MHVVLFTGSPCNGVAPDCPNKGCSGRPTKSVEQMRCGGGHGVGWDAPTLFFSFTHELKVKVKSTKVSDKPCGQSIELYLLSATFDQPVLNFSHPLCDVQFCVFVEEISSVQLTVQLIDKVGTC